MEIYKKQTLSETFAVYFDKRMLRILLLGIISGFPWVLIGSSLSLWLKEDGLSRSTIGWAGLIFAVYAFNYLWAPIVDRVRIPWLTNKIGHRRGWIVTMQAIILISLICWSVLNPTVNLTLVICIGLIIAILFEPFPNLFSLDFKTISLIFILGILSTGIATFVWFKIVDLEGPIFMSMVNYLIPVWALILGIYLLDESLNFAIIIGMALILSGIWLIQRKKIK